MRTTPESLMLTGARKDQTSRNPEDHTGKRPVVTPEWERKTENSSIQGKTVCNRLIIHPFAKLCPPSFALNKEIINCSVQSEWQSHCTQGYPPRFSKLLPATTSPGGWRIHENFPHVAALGPSFCLRYITSKENLKRKTSPVFMTHYAHQLSTMQPQRNF